MANFDARIACPQCRAMVRVIERADGTGYNTICTDCGTNAHYTRGHNLSTPERAPFLDEIKAHAAAIAELRHDVDVLQKLAIGGPALAAAAYAMPQDDAKARGELCDVLRTSYQGLATALATDAPASQIRDLATALAKCAFTISAFYSDRGAPR